MVDGHLTIKKGSTFEGGVSEHSKKPYLDIIQNDGSTFTLLFDDPELASDAHFHLEVAIREHTKLFGES